MSEIYSESLNLQESFAPPLAAPGVSPVQPGGGGALPCLFNNNSTEQNPETDRQSDLSKVLSYLLTSYQKRQAETLFLNVERLISMAPSLGHIGFFTLTFPNEEQYLDFKKVYERWRSFNSHWFSKYPEFGEWIQVKEPQKKGTWHFHMLVILKEDIRAGFDWKLYDEWISDYKRTKKRRPCPTGSPYLKKIWKDLRTILPKYGFGRSELLPVKSNAEAIGRYIGKYISKGISQRREDHKGVRLVSYSRGWPRNSVQFAWKTQKSHLWRICVQIYAEYHGCSELYQLSELLGPRWAFRHYEDITSSEITFLLIEKEGLCLPSYQDKKIKETTDRKEIREKIERKSLNLVVHKSQGQKQREESRQRVAMYKAEYKRVRKKRFDSDEIPF